MQAIRTYYLAPSNTKGARIVAHTQDHRRVYSWEHGLDAAENHQLAAAKLAMEMGWKWPLVSGSLPDHSSAHVFNECGWEIEATKAFLEEKA